MGNYKKYLLMYSYYCGVILVLSLTIFLTNCLMPPPPNPYYEKQMRTPSIYKPNTQKSAPVVEPSPVIKLTPLMPSIQWVLSIGISRYLDDEIPDLVFASKDAQDIAKIFSQQSPIGMDSVMLLTDEQATKLNIEAAIEGFLSKARSNDTIILYWAGHGYPDPEDPNKVYFACYDTILKKPYTGYRMDKVRDSLEEKKAANVIVLADTCHASKLITRGDRDLAIRPYIDYLIRTPQEIPRGMVFLVSSEADRKAIEHSTWSNGAFTHCLIKALQGEADGFQSSGEKDNLITLGELRAYITISFPIETEKVLGKAMHPVIAVTTSDPSINEIVITNLKKW